MSDDYEYERRQQSQKCFVCRRPLWVCDVYDADGLMFCSRICCEYTGYIRLCTQEQYDDVFKYNHICKICCRAVYKCNKNRHCHGCMELSISSSSSSDNESISITSTTSL